MEVSCEGWEERERQEERETGGERREERETGGEKGECVHVCVGDSELEVK